MKIGFQYYDEKPVSIKPTVQEILALMKSEQKAQVLNAFVKGIKPNQLKHKTGISGTVITQLYTAIDAIEEKSRILMRGEVLITLAEYDKEGKETKPAVHNIPPKTAIQLRNLIKDDFKVEFTENQIAAVLTEMIQYSKYTGNGDWVFYKSSVVK